MSCWIWSISPAHYPACLKTNVFAVRKVGRRAILAVQPGDVIFAYLPGRRVVAGMFRAVSPPYFDQTPLVPDEQYPHRVRVEAVVALSEEAWVNFEAFGGKLEVEAAYPHFGHVVQKVIHPLPEIDCKVLEFLVRARQASSLDTVLEAYDQYLRVRREREAPAEAAPAVAETPARYDAAAAFEPGRAVERLVETLAARGFVYEPWQVAAYVAAVRTKAFVILAGVTGVGKSRLPALVAEATGGVSRLVPVRPDWTDSADLLGYTDLQGVFRPGVLLETARAAMEQPDVEWTCIVDEMNLARVEQYLAEVLSRIEDRRPAPRGGFETSPLLTTGAGGSRWAATVLPANLALVGTVNMDESVHPFSRKVLDRAFTLELSEIDLRVGLPSAAPPEEAPPALRWPVEAWRPRALSLGGVAELRPDELERVRQVVDVLTELNRFLAPAGLQVGYRTRDESALFALHAAELASSFATRAGQPVDPLDLVLHMKVLPRIAGGSAVLHRLLLGLLGWTSRGRAFADEEEAATALDAWEAAGRPAALPGAAFPRSAARLCLMWERLLTEGFTSYWL